MAIIQTERNRVPAHAIGDDDVFVRISLLGYDETGARVARHLRYEPITEYQAAVDWAVSMADVMAHPIHVVPLNYDDMREPSRFDPLCAAVASMTDQERGEMRQGIIKSMIEVLRDCDDWRVRADAYDILVQLKVTYES